MVLTFYRHWIANFKLVEFYTLAISLVIFGFSEHADALEAKAKAKTKLSDFDIQSSNGTKGTGKFELGKNEIEIDDLIKEKAGPSEFRYVDTAGGSRVIDLDRLSPKYPFTRAKAFSQMDVNQPQNPFAPPGKYHSWTLELLALVSRASNESPAGKAKAKGNDPDFFDPASLAVNPRFEEAVTLLAKSSIFEENPLEDEAFTTFNRVSSLLAEPIFSIEIFGLGSSLVDAHATFNSHPSLSFSTTPSALESLLEDPNLGLGTFDGSISDISFNYTWDLSSFPVTSDDTIGGGGVSFAASAPEPSTLSLVGLGTLGILVYRRQRRKNCVAQVQ